LQALLLWLPCEVVLVCLLLYIFGVFGHTRKVPCMHLSDTRCYPESVYGTHDCR